MHLGVGPPQPRPRPAPGQTRTPTKRGARGSLHHSAQLTLTGSSGLLNKVNEARSGGSSSRLPSLHHALLHERCCRDGSLVRFCVQQSCCRSCSVTCLSAIQDFNSELFHETNSYIFWLWPTLVLGQGYGNEMSKQPVYELRLLSCVSTCWLAFH